MNIQEMHDFFDLVQDKVDSPYFEDAEKDSFLQRAELYLVNGAFYNKYPELRESYNQLRTPITSFEDSSVSSEALQPLTYEDLAVSSDVSGNVTRVAINTALVGAGAETGADYMHVLNMAKVVVGSDNLMVKYVRENDYYRFLQNDYKKATETKPQYRLVNNRVKTEPPGANNFTISVLKYPVKVELDNNISSNLPDMVHNEVVAVALSIAGIATKDEALMMLNKAI